MELSCSQKNENNIAIKKIKELSWVQCEKPYCLKWRKMPKDILSTLDNKPWFCDMNSHDTDKDDCSKPEEDFNNYLKLVENSEYSIVTSILPENSIVWAKTKGYCKWPAIVTCDQLFGSHVELDEDGDPIFYHVTYIGVYSEVCNEWLPESSVDLYGCADFRLRDIQKSKDRYVYKGKTVMMAMKEANVLLAMLPEDRLTEISKKLKNITVVKKEEATNRTNFKKHLNKSGNHKKRSLKEIKDVSSLNDSQRTDCQQLELNFTASDAIEIFVNDMEENSVVKKKLKNKQIKRQNGEPAAKKLKKDKKIEDVSELKNEHQTDADQVSLNLSPDDTTEKSFEIPVKNTKNKPIDINKNKLNEKIKKQFKTQDVEQITKKVKKIKNINPSDDVTKAQDAAKNSKNMDNKLNKQEIKHNNIITNEDKDTLNIRKDNLNITENEKDICSVLTNKNTFNESLNDLNSKIITDSEENNSCFKNSINQINEDSINSEVNDLIVNNEVENMQSIDTLKPIIKAYHQDKNEPTTHIENSMPIKDKEDVVNNVMERKPIKKKGFLPPTRFPIPSSSNNEPTKSVIRNTTIVNVSSISNDGENWKENITDLLENGVNTSASQNLSQCEIQQLLSKDSFDLLGLDDEILSQLPSIVVGPTSDRDVHEELRMTRTDLQSTQETGSPILFSGSQKITKRHDFSSSQQITGNLQQQSLSQQLNFSSQPIKSSFITKVSHPSEMNKSTNMTVPTKIMSGNINGELEKRNQTMEKSNEIENIHPNACPKSSPSESVQLHANVPKHMLNYLLDCTKEVEQRQTFEKGIRLFMTDIGRPIPSETKIGSTVVDLYDMFMQVKESGGYEQVSGVDMWNTVYAKSTGDEKPQKTSSVKDFYCKYLLAYDVHLTEMMSSKQNEVPKSLTESQEMKIISKKLASPMKGNQDLFFEKVDSDIEMEDFESQLRALIDYN